MRKKKFAGIVGMVMMILLGACEAFAGYANPIYVSGAYWGTYNLEGNGGFRHDIIAPNIYGTPVYAIEDGTIKCVQIVGTKSQYQGKLVSYGNVIYLYSNDGRTEARYAHLSGFAKCNPDYPESASAGFGSTYTVAGTYRHELGSFSVKKGEVIGYVGTTGNSSGSHLHFELWIDGQRVAPDGYISIDGEAPESNLAHTDNISPRDKVVAYAWEIYNYTWTSDKPILLHNTNKWIPAGTIRGIPYTLNWPQNTFEEYKKLIEDSKTGKNNGLYDTATYSIKWDEYGNPITWRTSMTYGMACATFVTDCVRQGFLPNIVLPKETYTGFHKRGNWLGHISTIKDTETIWWTVNYETYENYYKNDYKGKIEANNYEALRKLRKGDYLDNWDHVILVVENDTSSEKISYIDQTPVWDSNNHVGTHKGEYWYSSLVSKYYVPMYVDYPGDSAPEPEGIPIDSAHFPDNYFREYVKIFDTNSNGYFSQSELDAVTEMWEDNGPHPDNGNPNNGNYGYEWIKIESIEGIKLFRNLKDLCVYRDNIKEIDLSGMEHLERLHCYGNKKDEGYGNKLKSLNLRNCSSLRELQCQNNQIETLDLSGCKSLPEFWATNNKLTWISVDDCTSLKYIYVGKNSFEELRLYGMAGPVEGIYAHSCPNLKYVYVNDNPKLRNLVLNNCPKIECIWAKNSVSLSGIDIDGCTSLRIFEHADNVNIPGSKPAFTTSSLPDGCAGKSYSAKAETSSDTPVEYFIAGITSEWADDFTCSSTGRITGTPSKSGEVKITIRAVNYAGKVTKTFTVKIEQPAAPKIITTSLNEWDDHIRYGTIEATGTAPIKWTVTGLPTGLFSQDITPTTLQIRGVASFFGVYGYYSVNVTAANSYGSVSKTLIMKVIPSSTSPKIKPDSLTDGKVGKQYSQSLEYSLDVTKSTPITWTVTGLPNGLSYSGEGKTCKISGTPTRSGTFSVTAAATSPVGSPSKTFTLTINASPNAPAVDANLPECYVGEEYNGWIRVSGTTPITCTVSGLPSGLSRNSSTGTITGKAASAGTYTIKVDASNAAGSVSKSYSLTVKTRPVAPKITTSSLPSGKIGESYSATLSATGTTPISWSAAGLPSGLSCSSTGTISGTPTQAGTFTVKITASNSAGSDTRSLTLSIASVGNSEIIAPETGDEELVPEFKTHNLTLTGKISMNFYMNLPEIQGVNYMDGAKCYMEFDISGDKSNNPQPYDPEFTNSSGAYYGFTCYVNSVQMADDIRAVFHYGQNKSVSQFYTMKQYFDNILAKSTTSSESRNLMTAMVDYGHYMQLFLSSVNGWKLGTAHKPIECVNVYTEDDIERVKNLVSDYAIVRNTGNSGIEKVTFALELDSDTRINVYLAVKSDYRGSVSATLDGGSANVAVKQPDGRYMVQIADIPAHRLGDTHTIRVTAREEFDVKVSALSYVHSKLNSATADSDARKAVVSLYNYYAASVAYGKSTGQY